MPAIKLLLVEDDEDDYIITQDFLNDLGAEHYQLDWARTPEQAREFFTADNHDVCLLDYSLGAFTGLELMAEAHKLGFNAPIIMLTGHDDSALDADALSAGAVDYLVKNHLSAARLGRAIRYAVARREMERERLKRIRAQAENRSKSEFLAHLSHELRTPLTAILGYTDLLAHEVSTDPTAEYVHIIKRNGSYLLSLLNDVLDLSKIEAGKLDMTLQPVYLNELLSNIHSLMHIKAREKNIQFTIQGASDIPQQLITDATRLQQILINIIGNAIKFTDEGGVNVTLKADVQANRLYFEIKDTGVGIAANELNKLFQPFEQAASAKSRSELGTGLGLAISQKLAERLNGHITASSQPGKGSCFTLTLKELQLPEPNAWVPVNIENLALTAPQPSLGISGRILVADDLPELRNLLGHWVSRYGGTVVFASNGLQAIEAMHKHERNGTPIDLVLMDMQMPEMDGLTATRELRAQGFTQPVIAITAQTMLGEKEKCLAAGCNTHLGKPVQERQLISCIQRHLRSNAANHTTDTAPEACTQSTTAALLLVEDNADARTATTLLLEGLGWQVYACETISEAQAHLAQSSFTAVLTDLNLPDGHGSDFAQFINQQYNLPVIAVSGESLSPDELARSPFTGALLKPLSLDALMSLNELISPTAH
ncbi:response regulator [Simiduia sp. 21SJ11W-1]|uniref:response regulator n=1 Tax=Simiduia sp. 21SJ11W-1 TaxID=2909669 RepID=UPI0020A00508|nr:response regulator [Simiduia sp. 21SJ11W-1]UTA48503.1 response regulator [Simiduia sp. 21SJ11W-1]